MADPLFAYKGVSNSCIVVKQKIYKVYLYYKKKSYFIFVKTTEKLKKYY